MKKYDVEILRTIMNTDVAIENVRRLLEARKQGKVVSDRTVRAITSRLHEKIAMIQEALMIFTESTDEEMATELYAIESQLIESLRLVNQTKDIEIKIH